MLLKFGCQCRRSCITRSENYICFDDLTAQLIRAGDDRRFCNGWMFFQRALYFEWADAIARADNHVVGAAYEPEVAILVFIRAITSNVPITTYAGLCNIRIAQVFFEHQRRALGLDLNSNITLSNGGKFDAIVGDNTDLKAR